jgi:ribosomal protein S27E
MEWNAAKQAVACPYCGFVPKQQPAAAAAAAAEHDLEEALTGTGDDRRGYGIETTKVKCQSCNAISVFESSRVAQRCDFCASPSIMPYQETRDAVLETLLPVSSTLRVRDIVWTGCDRWFAPDAGLAHSPTR